MREVPAAAVLHRDRGEFENVLADPNRPQGVRLTSGVVVTHLFAFRVTMAGFGTGTRYLVLSSVWEDRAYTGAGLKPSHTRETLLPAEATWREPFGRGDAQAIRAAIAQHDQLVRSCGMPHAGCRAHPAFRAGDVPAAAHAGSADYAAAADDDDDDLPF